jgi:uncharacterized protein (TIGR03435 family)
LNRRPLFGPECRFSGGSKGSARKLKERIEGIMANRIGMELSVAKKIALALAATVTLATPIALGMTAGPATVRTLQERAASQKQLNFEAASVKPSAPGGGPFGRTIGGPGTKDPGRIRYSNMTLKAVLLLAYGVSDFQIEGPGWMESDRFDIDATMPPDSTREQFREMLRNLLAERFRIALRRETKELPAYTLVVAKGGPKLAASAPTAAASDTGAPPASGPPQFDRDKDGFPKLPAGGPPGMMQFMVGTRGRLQGRLQTMSDLADRLAYLLGRVVTDGTALTTTYDFSLTFATEGTALTKAPGPPMPPPPGGGTAPSAPDAEPVPDIFSAVQSQLGLKLESKKAPVEVIVIDHADRTPQAN